MTANKNINKAFVAAVNRIIAEFPGLKTVNIVVVGKTGSGKSTLINALLGEKLAPTGAGKPVTQNLQKYTKAGLPVCLYDTRGLELRVESQEQIEENIDDLITVGYHSLDINQSVHLILYCINTGSNRVEPKEIAFVKQLMRTKYGVSIPVMILLTQTVAKDNVVKLKETLVANLPGIVGVIPVLAEDYEVDDEFVIKAYGIDALAKKMQDVLPITIRNNIFLYEN